jgi:hypothetical protein
MSTIITNPSSILTSTQFKHLGFTSIAELVYQTHHPAPKIAEPLKLGDRCSQVAIPWDSDKMFFRRQQDSSFTPWREVVRKGNIHTITYTIDQPIHGRVSGDLVI